MGQFPTLSHKHIRISLCQPKGGRKADWRDARHRLGQRSRDRRSAGRDRAPRRGTAPPQNFAIRSTRSSAPGRDIAGPVRLHGDDRPRGSPARSSSGRPGASSSGGTARGRRRHRPPRPPSALPARRRPRVRHVDEAVALARVAEGERRRDAVEIVGAERQHVGERHRIVEIDERIHARERPAREHVLDQPLDRGAIARLLDAEALVGGAPRRDAGDLRQLRPAPASRAPPPRARRSAHRARPGARRDGQPLGDDERDAVVGKRVRDVGDGNLQRLSLSRRSAADYPLCSQK